MCDDTQIPNLINAQTFLIKPYLRDLNVLNIKQFMVPLKRVCC